MAKTPASNKRKVEAYQPNGKERLNNPPAGLVTPETDPTETARKRYQYETPVPSMRAKELDYDPNLDQPM